MFYVVAMYDRVPCIDEIEQRCWSDLSEIDVQFQIVRRLLRRGEVLAVTVLGALTEEWLLMLEDVVKQRSRTGTEVNAFTSYCSGNVPLFTCAL